MTLVLRRATESDIPKMHEIRLAVTENRLTDPSQLGHANYKPYIAQRGESWIAETDGALAGFASVDWSNNSVWALFVDPQHEGKGIGRILLQRLVARSTERGLSQISLSTTPGTRAEAFYERQGWKAAEIEANGEIRMNLALKLSGVNGEKAEI